MDKRNDKGKKRSPPYHALRIRASNHPQVQATPSSSSARRRPYHSLRMNATAETMGPEEEEQGVEQTTGGDKHKPSSTASSRNQTPTSPGSDSATKPEEGSPSKQLRPSKRNKKNVEHHDDSSSVAGAEGSPTVASDDNHPDAGNQGGISPRTTRRKKDVKKEKVSPESNKKQGS